MLTTIGVIGKNQQNVNDPVDVATPDSGVGAARGR